ncbi:MAG TPA: hypothetical protein VFF73_30380 [Planctomycetota bacterium]|nr:hypothetical protein [Planctomycetota bacterium]
MGLILDARCGACGFEHGGLKLGATMEQMSGERRSFLHLIPCAGCGDVATLELALGEPGPDARCPGCGGALGAAYRIVRMKGLALVGHECPRCRAPRLEFTEAGKFL